VAFSTITLTLNAFLRYFLINIWSTCLPCITWTLTLKEIQIIGINRIKKKIIISNCMKIIYIWLVLQMLSNLLGKHSKKHKPKYTKQQK
jgi:hypothetical protein